MQNKGFTLRAWNRSEEKRTQAQQKGLNVFSSLPELFQNRTDSPALVWLMVSAGDAIDEILFGAQGISGLLKPGDIVVDGANSFYKHTQARAENLNQMQVKLLDCGVSGGVESALTGPCLMVGGDADAYEKVRDLLTQIAQPGGLGYFGTSGAGHYVKMVHNAIEYGMMQSIAEGLNLLKKSPFHPDLVALTKIWEHGSIIEGRLISFIRKALEQDPELDKTEPEIGSLGTGLWASQEALDLGVPLTAITAAVFTRNQSTDSDPFLYKVIQALRAEFGAHTSNERPA